MTYYGNYVNYYPACADPWC